MMETMGKPAKDFDEIIEGMREAVKKKVRDAYKKGFDEGSLDVKQRAEGAYQKGFEDGKAQDSHGCEGCEWDGTPFDVCGKCRNSYENLYKQKEPNDEIKVGDEVKSSRGWTAVVAKIDDGDLLLMDSSGAVGSYSDISKFSKTGRHFDIDKILAEMRT